MPLLASMDSSVSLRLASLNISREQTSERSTVCRESASDEVLMRSVCGGGEEELAILFRRYAPVVRSVALRVLKDATEADDLVQDIFLLIHRLCTDFDPSKASVEFWILQMTYRRAISRRRYLKSRHFYTQVELDEIAVGVSSPPPAQPDAIGQILAKLDLQKVFGSLSDDQRKTLRLHFIEGYTLEEIAKMLGQTKGNIRHHSFRGLEKLRKLIFARESCDMKAV